MNFGFTVKRARRSLRAGGRRQAGSGHRADPPSPPPGQGWQGYLYSSGSWVSSSGESQGLASSTCTHAGSACSVAAWLCSLARGRLRQGKGTPGCPAQPPCPLPCPGATSLTSSPGPVNPGCWQADPAVGTQPGQQSKGTVTLQRVPQHPAGAGMSPGTRRCLGTHPRAGTYLLVVHRARGLVPRQQHVLQRDQVIVLAVCGGHRPPRRARRVPPKAPACLLRHRPGCGVLPMVGLTPQGPHSCLRQHRDMPGTVQCRLAWWGTLAGRMPPVGMGLSRARRLPPSAHPFPGARGLLGAPGVCGDSTGVTVEPLGAQGGLWGQRRGGQTPCLGARGLWRQHRGDQGPPQGTGRAVGTTRR